MAKIVGLADGSAQLVPPGYARPAASRVISLPAAAPLPRAPRRLAARPPRRVPGRPLPPAYVAALGDGLERLASLTLARKLSSQAPLSGEERYALIQAAGVPQTVGGQMLTERILGASADELGKGGIIGSISHEVSKVAKKVVPIAISPFSIVAKSASGLLGKVPLVGGFLQKAANLPGKIGADLSGNNIRAMTAGGIHSKLAQDAITGLETAGAAVGGALVAAPGALFSGLGTVLGGTVGGVGDAVSGVSSMLGSLVSGGESLVSTFGSSAAAALERVDPSLSGTLTSMFQSLGPDYKAASGAFDTWSRNMKSSPGGSSAVGKVGNYLYTMYKDARGRMSATRTPVDRAPSLLQGLPDGSYWTPQQLAGLGNQQPAMGTGYGPQQAPYEMQGANVSPMGGSSAAPAAPTAMIAGFPSWAVYALAAAAAGAFIFKGGGGPQGPVVSMGQGWYAPARRYAGNPKRGKRRKGRRS